MEEETWGLPCDAGVSQHSAWKAQGMCSWDIELCFQWLERASSLSIPGASHTLICTQITWRAIKIQSLVQKVQGGAGDSAFLAGDACARQIML